MQASSAQDRPNLMPAIAMSVLVQIFAMAPFSANAATQISGRVTDPSGAPIISVIIEWSKMSFGDDIETIDTTVTDADGKYVLPLSKCEEGYRLSAVKDGYAPGFFDFIPYWTDVTNLKSMALPKVPPSEKDFVLGLAHSINGKVVDEKGLPIPGVVVFARTPVEGFDSSFSMPSSPTPIPGNGAHSATTDAEGKFHLDGLPDGLINLNITAKHRWLNDGNYPVDTPCTLTMSGSGQPGRIHARVVDATTGHPVSAFIVARRHDPKQRAISEADGGFEIPDLTFEREYELHVYAKGFAPWTGNIKAGTQNDDTVSQIELNAAAPLLGRAVDAETHKPISGAAIVYGVMSDTRYLMWNELDKYVDGMHPLTSVQRAISDGAGEFWFCEDEQARGGLILQAPGYARTVLRAEDRAAAGADGVLEVPLLREAVVSGALPESLTMQSPSIVHIWKTVSSAALDETFEEYTCEAKGGFIFQNLAPGEYQMSIQRALGRFAYTTEALATVTVRAGEKLDVTRAVAKHANDDFAAALVAGVEL